MATKAADKGVQKKKSNLGRNAAYNGTIKCENEEIISIKPSCKATEKYSVPHIIFVKKVRYYAVFIVSMSFKQALCLRYSASGIVHLEGGLCLEVRAFRV